MKKKRIFFLGGAVLVFLFFTKLIPEPIIYDSEVGFGFLAAAGVAVLFFQGAKPEQKKMYTPENYESGKAQWVFAIFGCIAAAIVTVACVYFMNVPREHAYIKKNSVVVDGTVIDGTATTTKRSGSSTSYELKIEFEADGKKVTETVTVSSEEWDKVGKDLPILVSYAKGHPDMCKALLNANQVEKYSNSDKIRMLTLANLENLYHHRDSIQPELKKISMGWSKYDNDEGVDMYYNTVYWTILANTSHLFYVMQIDSADNFNSLLTEAKKNMRVVYDSMATNPKQGVLFENDKVHVRFIYYRSKCGKG